MKRHKKACFVHILCIGLCVLCSCGREERYVLPEISVNVDTDKAFETVDEKKIQSMRETAEQYTAAVFNHESEDSSLSDIEDIVDSVQEVEEEWKGRNSTMIEQEVTDMIFTDRDEAAAVSLVCADYEDDKNTENTYVFLETLYMRYSNIVWTVYKEHLSIAPADNVNVYRNTSGELCMEVN